VPVGVLERNFNYGKVATVEILDVMLFVAVAVAGVALGFGLIALAVATVLRAAISMLLALLLSGIAVGVSLRPKVIGDFARFGLPYAGSNVLNFANNAAAPVLVGTYASVSEFGILQLAYTLLFYPQTFTVIIGRIGFATYARVEANTMAPTLSRSTGELLRIAGGSTLVLATTSVLWIPVLYGDAWATASRYLLVVGPAFALVTSLGLVTAALNAVGRPAAVFALSIIFCVAYWVSAYVLVPRVGGLGLPVAYALATAAYCGYLALARASFGELKLGRVFLEYFAMCCAALGFVLLHVLGAPWYVLAPVLLLIAAWPVSSRYVGRLSSSIWRSRSDGPRAAKL
jgi:lipopolysaccharide exporter